jgi:acyl carrier protein
MDEKIKTVVARVLEIDPSLVNEQTSPGNVRGWDSLTQMNLVAALEDEFAIEFDDTEYEQMVSYPVIVAIVKSYLED